MKKVSLCSNDQCLAGWVIAWHGKNLNVAIFSDTINVVNVKLCMMVILIEIYLFILHLVTLIVSQDHSSVKQF